MGFGDIASLVGGGVGALTQSDSANKLLAQENAYAAKSVSDAQALKDKEDAQRAASLKLGTAFSQLAAYQAASAGNSGLNFTAKLGKPGGGGG